MATRNRITGLVVGQYGSPIVLTIVDDDGVVVNLSVYSSLTIKAVSPDGGSTLTFTGTLVGGGTGGQFSFTPTVNNTFDRDGDWEGQVQFAAASVLAPTVICTLQVDKKL